MNHKLLSDDSALTRFSDIPQLSFTSGQHHLHHRYILASFPFLRPLSFLSLLKRLFPKAYQHASHPHRRHGRGRLRSPKPHPQPPQGRDLSVVHPQPQSSAYGGEPAQCYCHPAQELQRVPSRSPGETEGRGRMHLGARDIPDPCFERVG